MSIIRKVLMSIIRCIGCGFVGALGAVILAVSLYFLATVFMPNDGGAALMILVWGYCGIFAGFALGAIYGAIRALTSLKRRTVLIAMSVISAAYLLMLIFYGTWGTPTGPLGLH